MAWHNRVKFFVKSHFDVHKPTISQNYISTYVCLKLEIVGS